MRAPSQEPVKIGTVDVEAFSRNLAQLIEQGGRALAAYLKPREEGRDDRELADELTEVVKTLGHVAEYWLADPQRTVELQTRLGKAYLDLWAAAAKRLAGEEVRAGRGTRRQRQALRRPGMVLEPVLRFPQAGLSAHHALGQPDGHRRRRSRSAHQAEGRVLYAADRQCALAVELRSDQSRIAARNLRPAMPRIWCAACACWPRMSRPAAVICASANPIPRCSRSAATWRRRPAT